MRQRYVFANSCISVLSIKNYYAVADAMLLVDSYNQYYNSFTMNESIKMYNNMCRDGIILC